MSWSQWRHFVVRIFVKCELQSCLQEQVATDYEKQKDMNFPILSNKKILDDLIEGLGIEMFNFSRDLLSVVVV